MVRGVSQWRLTRLEGQPETWLQRSHSGRFHSLSVGLRIGGRQARITSHRACSNVKVWHSEGSLAGLWVGFRWRRGIAVFKVESDRPTDHDLRHYGVNGTAGADTSDGFEGSQTFS